MALQYIRNLPSFFQQVQQQFYILIFSKDEKIVAANETFCTLTSFTEDQLIGKSYASIFQSPRNVTYMSTMNTFKGRQKDGSPFWLYGTMIAVKDEEGDTFYLFFGSNVTEQRISLEKTKKESAQLRNIEHALHQSSILSIADLTGEITYVNDRFCSFYGFERDELIGQTHRLVSSQRHDPSFFKQLWETIQQGKIWSGEIQNKAKDGTIYWMQTTIVPTIDENGELVNFIGIQSDITPKKEIQENLERALQNDFSRTVRHLQNIIFKYKLKRPSLIRATLVEGHLARNLGLTTIAINEPHFFKKHFEERERFRILRHLLRAAHGHQTQFEIEYLGHIILIYLSPIIEEGRVTEVVGTGVDITERKKAEERISTMAYYDELTGLPNRQLLEKLVTRRIDSYPVDGETFSLMFIDLDRFKNVNDSMGHLVGDKLLKAVGDRLHDSIRSHDIVSRLAGDEYVVILSSTEKKEVQVVAERIVRNIAQPFTVDKYNVYVTPSVGISMFPRDGTSYDELLRNADSAMYLAKREGKNNFQFFTEKLRNENIEKTLLEMDLRKALMFEQFSFRYQPIFKKGDDTIFGVEMNIVWNHPTRGAIGEQLLASVAETAGLVIPLGLWTLKKSCLQMKYWQEIGVPLQQMRLNIPSQLFEQPIFIERITELLKDIDLDPHFVNIQVHDTSGDIEYFQTVVDKLRSIGMHITLSQFGSGQSSYQHLSKTSVSDVKVDSKFIEEIDDTNQAILQSIVTLTDQLQLYSSLSNINTKTQHEFVQHLPYTFIQGDYYCPPLTKQQIELHFQNDIRPL